MRQTAIQVKPGPKPRTEIDEGLALAERLSAPGERWSHHRLAKLCKCSHARIQQIEREAMHKVQRRWAEFLKELYA